MDWVKGAESPLLTPQSEELPDSPSTLPEAKSILDAVNKKSPLSIEDRQTMMTLMATRLRRRLPSASEARDIYLRINGQLTHNTGSLSHYGFNEEGGIFNIMSGKERAMALSLASLKSEGVEEPTSIQVLERTIEDYGLDAEDHRKEEKQKDEDHE
jgi:hypothetical protein